MQLSEHFSLEEFTHSDTAKARGINNQPTAAHLNTIKHTCIYCLEPLRKLLNEKYGKASITLTSGYRGLKLNEAVGGVKTSQHCTGEAVDIQVYKYVNGQKIAVPFTETYNNIKNWIKLGKLSVDQCIQEQSGNAKWVHVSHNAAGKTRDRKQFLIYKNGIYSVDR